MSIEELESQLEALRQEYRKASESKRKVIIMQAKLIKWAIEKCEKKNKNKNDLYEQARRIFH